LKIFEFTKEELKSIYKSCDKYKRNYWEKIYGKLGINKKLRKSPHVYIWMINNLVIYIGETAGNTSNRSVSIINQILKGSHFHSHDPLKNCWKILEEKIKDIKKKDGYSKYRIILIPTSHKCLSKALESLLIFILKPLCNKECKGNKKLKR